MSDELKDLELIDLNALTKPIKRVKVGEKEYAVLPATGRSADILQQINAAYQLEGDARTRAIGQLDVPKLQREIVKESCPGMPEDVITGLNVEQRNAIIQIASGMFKKVEEVIKATEKNEGGP